MKTFVFFLIIILFSGFPMYPINSNQSLIKKIVKSPNNSQNIVSKENQQENQKSLLHVSDQTSEMDISQNQRVEFGNTTMSWPTSNDIGGDVESEMNAGRQIIYSPTGRYIATGGGHSDPTASHSGIRVWDLATNKKYWLQSTVTNTDLSVETLAFSPDEKYLATGDIGIHLWNITLGNKIKTLAGSDDFRVFHLLFSKNGSEIIASVYQTDLYNGALDYNNKDHNFQILFWNVETGALETNKTIILPYYSRDIALSPDGLILATGDYFDTSFFPISQILPKTADITLWNLSTNQKIKKLTGFTGAIRVLDFSPDGEYLVVGSVTDDNCVDGFIGTVNSLACNSNITVWDMQSYQNVFLAPIQVKGIVYQFGFSLRNNLFFSSSFIAVNQKDLQIWKIPKNFSESWVHDNFSISAVIINAITQGLVENFFAISPSEETLAYVWSNEEPIRLINLINDKNIPQTTIISQNPVSSIIQQSDQIIISSDSEGTIKLWNSTTNQEVRQFNGSLVTEIGCPIDYSARDNLLVSGNNDGSIHIYNFTSGALIISLKISNVSVISISFSSNGKWLATGSADGKIDLWNVSESTNISKIIELRNQISGITSLAFSPNNALLASGSLLSSVILWNLSTYQPVNTLLGHTNRITSLTFSPDSNSLASGSWDKSIIIWDVHTGKIEVELVSTTEINSIAYLYSNNSILSGGNDGIIYLWNAQSDSITTYFQSTSNKITSIYLSELNKLLVSGSENGVIEEWNMKTFYNDTDGDGMSNSWELVHGLNPNNYFDVYLDADNDGLSNGLEYKLQTNPNLNDTDSDGIPDRWEFLYQSNPNVPDSNSDTDNDKMSNLFEYQNGLNGLINDSTEDLDGDGLSNYLEFIFGSYANNPDSDNDGMGDLYEYQMSTREWCLALIVSTRTCRHYDFIDFYNDTNYGWYYSGLNPLVNDANKDLDRDGMPNIWECHMGLLANTSIDGGTELTAFNDKDHDGIPNLVEYLNGLNASDPLDAGYDHDSDGIPNLVEYQNGLNMSNAMDSGLVLTEYNDKDHDGMPNLWEYRNQLNISNSKDAFEDPDFDLISNLDEYKGGSNPHDIFSVPLDKLSILHIITLIILFIGCAIIIRQKIYKSIKKQLLYNVINAPSHSVADYIYKAGFKNYDMYLKAKEKAKGLLDKACLNSDNGLIEQSIQEYLLILDLLPFKGDDAIEAEALVRLALLFKDQGSLKENNIVFKNIPKTSSNFTIRICRQILEALNKESKNNWGEALELWTNVSKLKNLPIYYEMVSLRSLTEQYFRIWFYNQNEQNENQFKSQLDNLQSKAKNYDEKGELCRTYLLYARYFLTKYNFSDFDDQLDKCSQVIDKITIPYYKLYVDKTTEELVVDSERLKNLMKSEDLLLTEDKDRIMKKYLEKAALILSEESNPVDK